jgi:hypothetical protein
MKADSDNLVRAAEMLGRAGGLIDRCLDAGVRA